MTRRFYTDPLAAAWMTKHFGMRFQVVCGETMFTVVSGREQVFQSADGRLYIHLHSLRLLEPQAGDVVQNPDEEVARVCLDAKPVVMPGWVKLSEAKEFVGTAATIIQRDGKAFHWPESEAA